jgi:hypothetical protein
LGLGLTSATGGLTSALTSDDHNSTITGSGSR